MRLHKITLHGFKSFAEPTEFFFTEGITALVGPNGCGKSNVVDAFKWVLGSRSAKALRGEEMLDVIFNGSDGIPSAGYAEVSLSFTHNGDEFALGTVPKVKEETKTLALDYHEITITRRLYRSGESEYFINNQPCRLRDIRELFMDTGIGMESYSIIEQGGVDFVLSATPYERRSLFEEAAGISKYKARRKEAQTKLERVEQDLLRAEDLLREVKRNIRSIKIQASRAERYRQIVQKIREKKTLLFLHQYHELTSTQNVLLRKKEDLTVQLNFINEENKILEQSIIDIEKQIISLDNDLKRSQTQLMELNGQIYKLSTEIENGLKRKAELDYEADKAKKNLAQTTQQAINLKNTLYQTKYLLETTKKESETISTKLEELSQNYLGIMQALKELNESLEVKRNEFLNNTQKKSQYQNDLASIQTDLRNLSQRQERVENRTKEIDSELQEISRIQIHLEEEIQTISRDREFTKQDLTNKELLIKSLNNDLEVLLNEIAHLEAEKHKNSTRLEILQDLENNLEGISPAVKTILSQPTFAGKIYGMLADLLEPVQPENILAVETALGDATQALITRNDLDSYKIIKFIRDHPDLISGRLITISLESMTKHFNLNQPVPEINGVLGTAAQLVRTEERFKPIVEAFLGQYLLVENLSVARKILETNGFFRPILTLTGEVITAEGIITAGVVQPGMTVLSRKWELKELKEQLRQINEKLESLTDQKQTKTLEIKDLETVLQSLRHKIYEYDVALLEKKQVLDEYQRRVSLILKEKEINRLELSEISNQKKLLAQRACSTTEIIHEIETRLENLQLEIESLSRHLTELEKDRQDKEEELTASKITLAQIKQKEIHLAASIEQLNSQIHETEETLKGLSEEICQINEKITKLVGTISEQEVLLNKLHQQKVQNETYLNELKQNLESLKQSLAEKKAEQIGKFERIQKIEASLREIFLQEQECVLKAQALEEKAREEYGINLSAVYQNYTDNPETDWVAVAQEIEEARQNLESMSDVNLAAIDQLKELENRHSFLTSQITDLVKSKRSLQELIRKINSEAQQMFQETFTRIQENFNLLFRKLFGGGKAELVLVKASPLISSPTNGEEGAKSELLEPVSPSGVIESNEISWLEDGIEIIAKPPGKEPTSISLLSGGEKALTALALIMALFRLNPSPFCILDEADAMLDDTNIDRFIGLLREFTQTTQFIVITHNKKTMLAADCLYGLTMQKSGVSKKVSVNLTELNFTSN